MGSDGSFGHQAVGFRACTGFRAVNGSSNFFAASVAATGSKQARPVARVGGMETRSKSSQGFLRSAVGHGHSCMNLVSHRGPELTCGAHFMILFSILLVPASR